MENRSYWKVVLRYGHVGHRNEICIARYLVFDQALSLLEVCEFARQMPGVKHGKMVNYAKKIDYTEYVAGKESEKENLFLQKLMTFHPKHLQTVA